MRSQNLKNCNIFLILFQFERKAARENEITGVSSSAVAKYLERKRKEKERIEGKYFNIVHTLKVTSATKVFFAIK